MSNHGEEISALAARIVEVESEIAAAKKERKSDEYIIACKYELIELRKKEKFLMMGKLLH